jgi:hypothetical protein
MNHITRAISKIARPTARLVNRLLVPVSLRAIKTTPRDLRGVVSDPIEATYHVPDKPFVIDAALQNCRGFAHTCFACTAEARHPFVETLLAYGRGECDAFGYSPLRSFYENWQPANAAEALGLDPYQAHPALRNAPAIGAVMPWERTDPDTMTALRIHAHEATNRAHGASLSCRHGFTAFGPVSEAKGELEFNRLTRVYDSIRRSGYRRSDRRDGDIHGLILTHNGANRIKIGPGHHRIAALAALGYERAPIRLRPFIIRRDDVGSWPNVRSGFFTQEQALAFFDRIFDGRQPPGCIWTSRWNNTVHGDCRSQVGF